MQGNCESSSQQEIQHDFGKKGIHTTSLDLTARCDDGMWNQGNFICTAISDKYCSSLGGIGIIAIQYDQKWRDGR